MEKLNSLEKILKRFKENEKELKANCFYIMKPKLIEYMENKSLTISFPVLEEYLNPNKSMQGGFITAAFDNAFGSFLVCIAQDKRGATIDITTSYQKPIFLGDELIITVYLKSMGKTIVNMNGEAYNKEKDLISTCSTNIMIVN